MTTEDLTNEMLRMQDSGAHNINFVSPSHVVWQIADAVMLARSKGFTLPVVYNSGGYDSIEALRKIKKVVDIYMPDIKYMDHDLAEKLSGASDYVNNISGVLEEMFRQTGALQTNPQGIATKGLLIRHLVLPGHPENSRKCLEVIAGLSKDIPVSLMSQYTPQFKASSYPEINRRLEAREYYDMVNYALSLGLHNLFTQDITSQDQYLPNFNRKNPFDR